MESEFRKRMRETVDFAKKDGYNFDNIMPVSREEMKKKLAEDEHLNNIPLRKWDSLQGYFRPVVAKYNKSKGKASAASLSECVCLAKEWARTEYIK